MSNDLNWVVKDLTAIIDCLDILAAIFKAKYHCMFTSSFVIFVNQYMMYLTQDLNIITVVSGVRSMHSTDIQWSAILSWGYVDNILRLKSKQSEPPVNFIQSSHFHQVNLFTLVTQIFIYRMQY